MKQVADMMAEHACIVQDCGFDMVYMHMAYRLMLLGRFLSPRTNTRTDDYGGKRGKPGAVPSNGNRSNKRKMRQGFSY